MAGKGMLRIACKIPHPLAQLRLMHAKISRACDTATPRSLISFTASSLNSRVNFRLSMTTSWFHKNTKLGVFKTRDRPKGPPIRPAGTLSGTPPMVWLKSLVPFISKDGRLRLRLKG